MRVPSWLPLVVLIAAGCSSKPATEPVRIGHLLALDGLTHATEEHARQGAELAVADWQAAGQSVAGRPVAVLHVACRGDASTVQAEMVRLATVNKVAALLADCEPAWTEQLLRANQPYGVPLVVCGELPAASDAAGVLSLGVLPAARGRLLARYAFTELKLHRVAVLTDSRRPVAAALASAFVKNWPRDKGGALEEWTFASAAERDERIERVIQAAPAVVLLACSLADFRAMRPRLAAKLPKVPLLYGGADAGAAALRAELDAGSDVYLATGFSLDHLTESGRDFARRYAERFHEPPDLHAARAYDATRLLLDVLQEAGSGGKGAQAEQLAHREAFDSVTGPIRWKQRQPSRRVFLLALTGNRVKVVRTIEPEEN